ncbi:MAG: primosomal protein N' [Chlorobi bacterium]|nr:primosomal protein N' [Chlorobiota bacterium]
MFAEVVFPMPFRNAFTYSVPSEFSRVVKTGIRVVAPFGKRVLTGFVISVKEKTDVKAKIKPIIDALDSEPIFSDVELKFYEWLADYYLCSLGEALRHSVPAGLSVESKKIVVPDTAKCREIFEKEKNKSSVRSRIAEFLSEKESARITTIQKIAGRKNIYSQLKSLEKAGAITIVYQIENAKVRTKTLNFVKLAKPIDEIYDALPSLEKRSPKQFTILLELTTVKEFEVQLSELLKKTKASQSSVESLQKKGFVEIFEKEIERVFSDLYSEDSQTLTPTADQRKIISGITENIRLGNFKPFLLHGITGSGKTQVYIELTKKALALGKTALILVPEISLTPQITTRFTHNFGGLVTVIHSRTSHGERYDSWRGIISGKYKVVIGARSALFSPLNNLGLIVVDEEHDASYKQWDMTPRYNARDAAVVKANLYKCPIILGSATPSIESRYNAETGKYEYLELKERIDDAKLPHIRLIDITAEKKKKRMEHIFSQTLINSIAEKLRKKEGVIILQNRRGFATQVYCDDCGELITCDNCSVPMVHHLDANKVQCHYCGTIRDVPRECPNCGSLSLKFFGTGTQRVEDELQYHFPNVKIERVDSDAIMKRGQLTSILNRFKNNETNILVGTQMVSKGLDFSHVTLVGVISAETTLWLPDFRADERTFQLLTQVAGRAGRSAKPGEVIIQTLNKKNFVLEKVLTNDYDGFYQKELKLRMRGEYPPFTRLCLIETKDKEERKARGAANDLHKYLLKQEKPIKVSPVTQAVIYKLKGFYRYQIIVRSRRSVDVGGKGLRSAVLDSYIDFNRFSRFKNVKVLIDIDPQSVV